jgi:hypothetical protein
LPGFGNDTHGLGWLTLVDGGEFSLKRLNVLEATMYFGGSITSCRCSKRGLRMRKRLMFSGQFRAKNQVSVPVACLLLFFTNRQLRGLR